MQIPFGLSTKRWAAIQKAALKINHKTAIYEEYAPYGLSRKQWATIQNAALKIDPKTAIHEVHYAFHCDPYWADKDLPDEYKCNCPNDYARSPGSDILVCFEDLPKRTRAALYKRLEKESVEARRRGDSDEIVEEIYEI